MQLNEFLTKVQVSPESIKFEDTMAVVEAEYLYTPISFTNGAMLNQAGENEGSCKIFAFASLHKFTKAQTLECFGQYYRNDVLKNPAGDNHQNIRNFMQTGWDGIAFDGDALVAK
jgi:hypothetical protein